MLNRSLCQSPNARICCATADVYSHTLHRATQLTAPKIFLPNGFVCECDKSAADKNKNDINFWWRSTYENESLRHSSILMISSIFAADTPNSIRISFVLRCVRVCMCLTVHTFTLFTLHSTPQTPNKIQWFTFQCVFPSTQYLERSFAAQFDYSSANKCVR